MTKDDITHMAREAGWWTLPSTLYFEYTDDMTTCILRVRLERFANLVAAAEREACAKVCEAEAAIQKESAKFCKVNIDQRDFSICAAAIRARSQS